MTPPRFAGNRLGFLPTYRFALRSPGSRIGRSPYLGAPRCLVRPKPSPSRPVPAVPRVNGDPRRNRLVYAANRGAGPGPAEFACVSDAAGTLRVPMPNERDSRMPAPQHQETIHDDPRRGRSRPATTCATSPSSRTSTTARPRWSTRCCGSPARSARTPTSTSGSWTPTTWSARRASPSSRRTPRSSTAGLTINIIDTPGHADFGGEVERGLSMVDGVVLLVDASEGPLPQTRFVLRKALEANLPVILVINKVDRPDSRIAEVIDAVLRAVHRPGRQRGADRVPDRLRLRAGRPRLAEPAGGRPAADSENLEPLFDVIQATVPAPVYDPAAPLQAHVTNLDAQLLPRPHRALPDPQRHDQRGPAGRLDASTTAPSSG